MRWHRIHAILWHSWYHFTHSKETWIDLLWFTFIQMLVFGFIARLIGGTNELTAKSLMLGFLVWEIVRIGQYCITVSLLWDIWSRSLNNLFISPLSLVEWMTGQMLSGAIKTSIVIGFLSVLATYFFNYSVFELGPVLILYFIILLSFSYAAGIFIAGLLFRFGTDIQSLAWGMIFLLQPISAIYYPVEALPIQVRWFSYLSPITYLMEAARLQYAQNRIDWTALLMATSLTITYILLASLYLRVMYKWSQQTGSLARLGQ